MYYICSRVECVARILLDLVTNENPTQEIIHFEKKIICLQSQATVDLD